jgi:hypothetical protein
MSDETISATKIFVFFFVTVWCPKFNLDDRSGTGGILMFRQVWAIVIVCFYL